MCTDSQILSTKGNVTQSVGQYLNNYSMGWIGMKFGADFSLLSFLP